MCHGRYQNVVSEILPETKSIISIKLGSVRAKKKIS